MDIKVFSMIGLSVFIKIFLLSLTFCSLGNSFRDRNSYPTIQDVVSFKTPEPTESVDVETERTIDIEKLDVHRLKQDDTAFRNFLMGNLGGDLLIQDEVKEDTRRVQTFSRQYKYADAYKLQYRSKMADVMLQLIYMARSKIKSFEGQGHVNRQSSEYRVGFIIRQLEKQFFRSKRYFTVMVEKQIQGKWDTESTSILNLHHKIVMAHHDFVRLFFMQMHLHERLEQYQGRPIHSMSEETESTTR